MPEYHLFSKRSYPAWKQEVSMHHLIFFWHCQHNNMPSNKDAVTDVTMTISRKNSSLNLIYKAIRERKKIQKKNHKTKHHSIDTPKNEEKKNPTIMLQEVRHPINTLIFTALQPKDEDLLQLPLFGNKIWLMEYCIYHKITQASKWNLKMWRQLHKTEKLS